MSRSKKTFQIIALWACAGLGHFAYGQSNAQPDIDAFAFRYRQSGQIGIYDNGSRIVIQPTVGQFQAWVNKGPAGTTPFDAYFEYIPLLAELPGGAPFHLSGPERPFSLSAEPINDFSWLKLQDSVIELEAPFSNFGDDDAPLLKVMKRLTHLNLQGSRLTSAGLEHIAEISTLETLNVSDTAVDTRGVIRLAKCPNLKALFMGGTEVDDAGVLALNGRLTLSRLYLQRTRVSSILRSGLPSFSSLEELSLAQNNLNAEEILRLQSLRRLRFLDVGVTAIGDEMVELGKGSGNLEVLLMDRTHISENGLRQLKEIGFKSSFELWSSDRKGAFQQYGGSPQGTMSLLREERISRAERAKGPIVPTRNERSAEPK